MMMRDAFSIVVCIILLVIARMLDGVAEDPYPVMR